MRDINIVLKDHAQKIIAIPEVVGLYVGELTLNKPCVRIMVIKKTKKIIAKIPTDLEGWPVQIDETGEITALD